MNCISAVISFIAFGMIYVFAITKPMPYFLLSPSYKKPITGHNKVIGKYKFPEGKGIVFEPCDEYKGYLEKYMLFVYKKRKYIKCRLSGDVVSLRYEVAVYNEKDKLIKVFELGENVIEKKETQSILLPDNTAYVSVVLRSVNEKENFSTLRSTSIVKICIFSVLTVAMTVACGLLTRTAILSVSALFDSQLYIGLGANLISSSIVGALVAFLCLVIHKKQVFGEK